jgi:hypothetical protein
MQRLIVLFLLLVPCSSFVFSAASQEQPTVSPGSSEWNELFDPPFTKPTEIPGSSPLRKSLFAQLRPLIEKEARRPVRFEGSLRAFKNWAFFVGRTVDMKGQSVKLSDMENDDTVALWLRTSSGWRLINFSGGHSDAFYIIWPQQYGMPEELLTTSDR